MDELMLCEDNLAQIYRKKVRALFNHILFSKKQNYEYKTGHRDGHHNVTETIIVI